ncbi:MAG: hypothetical protein ACYS30_22725 [Planctomycetota bacterium]|jgi:hypothetical protein
MPTSEHTREVEAEDSDYPETVEEILSDRPYRRRTMRALRAFKESGPWSGTFPARQAKFFVLHAELCRIYRQHTALLMHPSVLSNVSSGESCYNREEDIILLVGKLSVLTYLHEFGHVLKGHSEREACMWSVNLFRKVFPEQFERLTATGHYLTHEEAGA